MIAFIEWGMTIPRVMQRWRHPQPQPPLTHAVTHDPNIGPTTQPRPKHWTHNPNTGPNREGRERRDGVWVRREERTEMEKQIREGRERKELKFERKIWRGKFFFFFLTYCYNTILSLELYCSIIAKIFAIVRFTIVWCKCFWTLKCQKCLKYSISILQC